MKVGTSVEHGRFVSVNIEGIFVDGFYKEGKVNGPVLIIFQNGEYIIEQWEDGVEVIRKGYKADGTPR